MTEERIAPKSWGEVREIALQEVDWATRKLSPWEALLDASLRLLAGPPHGGEAVIEALIKYCKVPAANLKKLDLDRRVALLFRVPPKKIAGALAHLGGLDFPVDLFVDGLAGRLNDGVTVDELRELQAQAAAWDLWPAPPSPLEAVVDPASGGPGTSGSEGDVGMTGCGDGEMTLGSAVGSGGRNVNTHVNLHDNQHVWRHDNEHDNADVLGDEDAQRVVDARRVDSVGASAHRSGERSGSEEETRSGPVGVPLRIGPNAFDGGPEGEQVDGSAGVDEGGAVRDRTGGSAMATSGVPFDGAAPGGADVHTSVSGPESVLMPADGHIVATDNVDGAASPAVGAPRPESETGQASLDEAPGASSVVPTGEADTVTERGPDSAGPGARASVGKSASPNGSGSVSSNTDSGATVGAMRNAPAQGSSLIRPVQEGRGRGVAGRPRLQTADEDLGVEDIKGRLDPDYTTAYVNAYFMAQAKAAILPQIQVTWRATERPTWYYHKPYAGLVSAIAEVIGIPHKSPVGILMLTAGLQLVVATVPQVAKILKAKDGSLVHLDIPQVVKSNPAPTHLTTLLIGQLQEEIGISTLPIAIRKQNSWSAKGHRDNWTMPKALQSAIRIVAQELKLDESAIVNLALTAGVCAFENRLDPFIVSLTQQ